MFSSLSAADMTGRLNHYNSSDRSELLRIIPLFSHIGVEGFYLGLFRA